MTTREPKDYQAIAKKVRTGEFFQEGRQMYDLLVHDLMAERYLYVLITAMSGLILLITVIAMQSLYPLRSSVPFIVSTTNIAEDLPRIRTLLTEKGESASAALLGFLVNNYVTLREEYDISTFDKNINGVRSQTSPEVFAEFQEAIDPRNPGSPITLYQRHSRRNIEILSFKRVKGQELNAQVTFEASVESKTETKKTLWQADIAFNYSGIALDEETQDVKPLKFVVTGYKVRRIQQDTNE